MMELPTKIVSMIGAAGTAIATFYGGATFVDHRYAHNDNLVMVEMRLEQKILTDRSVQLQQRLWKIEDRYGPDLFEAPAMVKEEHRQIQIELNDLNEEVNAVQQEYRKQGLNSSRYYERKAERK